MIHSQYYHFIEKLKQQSSSIHTTHKCTDIRMFTIQYFHSLSAGGNHVEFHLLPVLESCQCCQHSQEVTILLSVNNTKIENDPFLSSLPTFRFHLVNSEKWVVHM